MIQVLRLTLRQLLGSKKFVTALATVLTASLTALLLPLGRKVGVEIDESWISFLVTAILGLGGATVVGQGLQDRGKEAARIDAIGSVLEESPNTEVAGQKLRQAGLLGFSNETLISLGAQALLSKLKSREVSAKIRAIALKLYKGIGAAYADDPDFQ